MARTSSGDAPAAFAALISMISRTGQALSRGDVSYGGVRSPSRTIFLIVLTEDAPTKIFTWPVRTTPCASMTMLMLSWVGTFGASELIETSLCATPSQ